MSILATVAFLILGGCTFPNDSLFSRGLTPELVVLLSSNNDSSDFIDSSFSHT